MKDGCQRAAASFTVGVQLVRRFRDDLGVHELGYAFEQAPRKGERRPLIQSEQ